MASDKAPDKAITPALAWDSDDFELELPRAMEGLRRETRLWIGKPGQHIDETVPLSWEEMVVHPESRLKIAIMFATLLLLVYIILAVPFVIGFEVDIKTESSAWWHWDQFFMSSAIDARG